jgi:SAM-dependent methyltransferase
MKESNLLRKFYAFNQYNRDGWVQGQALKIAKGIKVLDVGAGSAPYRNLFNHCEYKTHDFAQLNDNQLRGLKGYDKIDFVSDISNIPVDDESFDVILCTEVLEHIPYPIIAVKEFSRILKRGGVLLLSAPLGSGLHQEPYHFYGGYTPYWYDKFLTEYGFKIIELEPNMKFNSFFSQEFIRFIRRTAPWNSIMNFIFTPIWLLLLPFSLILPLIAPIYDKKDTRKDFTIGYHVVAIKN